MKPNPIESALLATAAILFTISILGPWLGWVLL